MNAYDFIINLKDYASSSLNNIAASVGITNNRVGELNNNFRTTERSSGNLGSSMSKLKNILASVFDVSAIWSFTNKVVDARVEHEKFNTVLTNTFQSDKVGAGALNMLTDFATKTPFQLNELTGSFVKLVNGGFAPTMNEMTKLGDLASSQGKGFDQLTDAMLDAQTGEFKRLKEFGIQASKHGDKVTLSFKGVTKEVNNNSNAITQALLEYGKLPGVTGAMEAESKTLGGQISNLGEQWNTFLVNVGGESGGIFMGAISILSMGLTFLTAYLPYVSEWFSILWTMIEPVVTSLVHFMQVAFRFTDVGTALSAFGNIMSGVLLVVNIFITGISTLIDWLSPFATQIIGVAVAWGLFNGAIALFNVLLFASPITWIIISIVALIAIIGLVTKYTSGWGESWKHTVNGAKFIWETYSDYVKANFNTLVNVLMIGIDKIKIGWYKFKEAVGMGNSAENQAMISQIGLDVEARKKSIVDGYKKMADSAMKAKNEFSQVGITVDTAGMSKDFKSIQDKFSGLGKKDTGTGAYDDYLTKQKGANAGKGDGKDKAKPDSIVSGGSKMTHITINIQKLQDDTKIYVESTEKGLANLGEKVQEMLLRSINSVNQMQTD